MCHFFEIENYRKHKSEWSISKTALTPFAAEVIFEIILHEEIFIFGQEKQT